jgi:predicted enzyme related to lactoylglutathione lyase
MEPIETPVCFMAVVADPDGNQILIHHRKDGTFG